MLTDTSLALITFINLFLIPLISLRIYTKRNSIEWVINFDLVYKYALFCIMNLPFTRLFTSMLEKIGIVCLPDSSKYTLVAIVSAILLALLFEIIKHYVDIEVVITYASKSKNKKDEE